MSRIEATLERVIDGIEEEARTETVAMLAAEIRMAMLVSTFEGTNEETTAALKHGHEGCRARVERVLDEWETK